MVAGEAPTHTHSYSPKELLHLPDYVPNLIPASTILGSFAGVSILVLALVWLTSGRLSSTLLKIHRLLMCWWSFTGLVHIIVEGYVAFSPEFYKDNTGFFLAEIWKEYSKADSRYAARDSSVIYAEGFTAL